jgi:aryl-phospho-beta-D-glucosidase BglC (GH1 family)
VTEPPESSDSSEETSLGVRTRRLLTRWWLRTVLPSGRLIAFVLTAVVAFAAVQPSTVPSNGAAPREDETGGRSVPLTLGVTVFSMWRDWDQHDQWFQEVADSGSKWLRVDVGWCSLEESGPGLISQWYQGRLDVTADAAEKLGMRLVIQLGCAPKWAGGTGFNDYPTDPGQFQRVAHYLADRYKGKVAAWEIWNEPNCIGGCGNGSPDQYVAVLKAGYRGIKTGDPDVTVVSAGTSGNDVNWLRRMYAAGAAGFFDALAVHPYQDPATAAPDAPSQGNTYRLSTLPMVHRLMVANGDGAKPIWLTEFGWTTAKTGPRPGVDDDTQARYLAQAVRQIRSQYPYVTHAFWFCLRDRDDSTPYENNFGLLHVRGSPKPAFAAMQKANADLENR